MTSNERVRIIEMIEEYQKVINYYETKKTEPLYDGLRQAYTVVIKDLRILIEPHRDFPA